MSLSLEAGEQRETHDLAVVVDPVAVAHLAFLDVGDDVVDDP